MKVKEGKTKYSTKYKVNATSILDARSQNKVISAFSVLKIPFLIEWKLKFHMKGKGYEMQYYTKFQDNAENILEAITKSRVISALLVLKMHVAYTTET